MLGRKPFNPNAYVPPVDIAAPPLPASGGLASPDVPTLHASSHPNWLGVLADALSGLAGGPGLYAQRAFAEKQQQSAFERGEEQYQHHRHDNLDDQMTLLQYKMQHPDDQLTEYLNAGGITDPAERQRYYRQKADAMTAPPMMSAQGVDDQGNPVMRFFPRAQPIPPPSTPAPAVGTVKGGYRFKGGNPASPDAWEPAGGASSGSRTFP